MSSDIEREGITGLRRGDLDSDPVKQFGKWFDAAAAAGVKMPEAMALATVSPDGTPSLRMVLLKGFGEDGFVFFTNYESRKGSELGNNPNAALLFYWSALDRQVRISGRVEKISREESELYFQSRPLDSRLSAWASNQSRVVSSRAELEERMKAFSERYADGNVPLPPHWGGYRLSPKSFEFWQNRPGRLHDRFHYTRQAEKEWRIERLSP